MKRKRIKKYNTGGFSGLLQGAAQGAPMGLPGMIIGGGLGFMQGQSAGAAEKESLRMAEEQRKLAEEQREIELRNADIATNKAILDAYPVQGTATPRFDKGGNTNIDAKGNMSKAMSRKDGVMENLLEFVDPSGITSWDDAYRAYNSMKESGRAVPNFEEFVDMLGAVPLVGKVGKGAKLASTAMKSIKTASQGARAASAAGKLINAVDAGQDIYSDNFKSSTGMSKTKEPRFDKGGKTGGGLAETKDYDIRDIMDGVKRAKTVTPQQHKTKAFHIGMNPALQPLTAALGQMSEDEWANITPKINKIVADAQQMQADGKTSLGEGLGFFKDLDLSFIKPIRNEAGMSKGDVIDGLFEAVDPQGKLGWAERTAMGAAASMKDFAYGGKTTGGKYKEGGVESGEKYFAIPNYNGSMDPNAQPSMDFYFGGQQMPASEFINHLPEGITINDVVSHGMKQAKPRFVPESGWANAGTNSYMQDFQAMKKAPKLEHGGDTPKFFNAAPTPNMPMGRELRHERGMPYYMPVDAPNGSIRQWEPGMMDYLQEAFANTMNPMRAIADADYMQGTDNYNHEGGLMMRAGLNKRDALYANNKHDILPDWVYGLAGVEKKAMGGMTQNPEYEVEGGEMMQTTGERPRVYGQGGMSQVASNEFEVKGPKHSNGGVKASDNNGARVYSDKLKVDSSLVAKLMKL